MTARFIVRPEAAAEIFEARRWYDAQRAELGERFAAEVDRVFTRLQNSPLTFPAIRGEVRRALVRGFPYGVFYRARVDEVVVLAVVHFRRHPRRWRSRR